MSKTSREYIWPEHFSNIIFLFIFIKATCIWVSKVRIGLDQILFSFIHKG